MVNLDDLQLRVKNKTKELEFYKKAYRVMISYYYIQNFDDINSLDPKADGLEQEFYETLVKGEMPSDDMFLRISDEFLDVFLHSALFVIGTILGVMDLTKRIDDEEEKFIQFLLHNTDQKTFLTRNAFAALSLSLEQAPTSQMLMTLFPKTKSEELQERQIETMTALYGVAVRKAIEKTSEGTLSESE